jgi:hypothetical protein
MRSEEEEKERATTLSDEGKGDNRGMVVVGRSDGTEKG